MHNLSNIHLPSSQFVSSCISPGSTSCSFNGNGIM